MCAAKNSYRITPSSIRQRILFDLEIPEEWEFNKLDINLENVFIIPRKIKTVNARCKTCGSFVKIIPSFYVEGTILTYKALIFIVFIYEYTAITWRELAKILGRKHDCLIHSTLSKGAQKLGKSLDLEKLLEDEFFKIYPALPIDQSWPKKKSRKTHTLKREQKNRTLLQPLQNILFHQKSGFVKSFKMILRTMLYYLNKTIPRLLSIYEKP